jgi:hypothetical protein
VQKIFNFYLIFLVAGGLADDDAVHREGKSLVDMGVSARGKIKIADSALLMMKVIKC